jgi:hypothetical protein
MRRALIGGLSLLAGAVSPLIAHAQVIDYCLLLEARIVADDGQFLGRITPDTTAFDSLMNPFGEHGSEFSQISIFNPIGAYGGMFALLSPYSTFTFFPPRIILNAQTLARLTLNQEFSPRVEPDELVAWLRSEKPALCFEPTPTPSPDPTTALPSTATATQTPLPTSTGDLPRPDGTPTVTRTSTARPSSSPPPPPARTSSPTIAARATVTPFDTRGGAGSCAIVAPRSMPTAAIHLLPLAVLLWRRRQR